MEQTETNELRPEQTIGYCVECNKLVHRTEQARCEQGHLPHLVHGVHVMKEGEPEQVLPTMNWGAFFMAPLWGPAHGAWAGVIVLPLWLFCDSAIRAAYYTTANGATIGARIAAWILAIVLPVLTLSLMRWLGTRGWGLAWRRTYRVGTEGILFETFLKRERVWAYVGGVLFFASLIGALYYWITVMPTTL